MLGVGEEEGLGSIRGARKGAKYTWREREEPMAVAEIKMHIGMTHK